MTLHEPAVGPESASDGTAPARKGSAPARAVPATATALARVVGRGLVHLLFRVRVTGLEQVPKSGGVLLAPNHRDFLDGPLLFLLSPRPVLVLAKSELLRGPWAGVLRLLDQLPVRRGAADRRALRSTLDALRQGHVVGVFPEGTRGSGRFDDVVDGLAYFALKAGVPVVPVALLGTATSTPRRHGLLLRRAPLHVAFGAPVHPVVDGDARVRRTVAEASAQLQDHLRAHLAREEAQL